MLATISRATLRSSLPATRCWPSSCPDKLQGRFAERSSSKVLSRTLEDAGLGAPIPWSTAALFIQGC